MHIVGHVLPRSDNRIHRTDKSGTPFVGRGYGALGPAGSRQLPRQGSIVATSAGASYSPHPHEARGPKGHLPVDLLRRTNTEQLCERGVAVHNEFTAIIE